MKTIYDNTPEDDHQFMVERINALNEYLSISESQCNQLKSEVFRLKVRIEELEKQLYESGKRY